MSVEDHLVALAKGIKSTVDSLGSTTQKILDELTKTKQEPTVPDGATSKPLDIPGWEPTTIEQLPSNWVFQFGGNTFQLVEGKNVLVRDQEGVLLSMICSRALRNINPADQNINPADQNIYFHPLCVVTAPKKG